MSLDQSFFKLREAVEIMSTDLGEVSARSKTIIIVLSANSLALVLCVTSLLVNSSTMWKTSESIKSTVTATCNPEPIVSTPREWYGTPLYPDQDGTYVIPICPEEKGEEI